MTLRDAVIAHRDWQVETIARCDDQMSALDPDDHELRAAWFARKTHAENSRDRLTQILETSEC